MRLTVSDVSYSYPRHFTLRGISLEVSEPITALIGPNGAGKSTLMKCLANRYPCRGSLRLNGAPVDFRDRDFFRTRMSYLSQNPRNQSSITVYEAVLLGLMNDLFLFVSARQRDAVEQMLHRFELEEMATRSLRELSGGQLQLVLLAQALIKEPEILLLDEPLNNLDVHRQFSLMNTITSISSHREMLTIIVMHDINLAARYADRIAVLHEGQLHEYGTPSEVLTSKMMREVYRLETKVHIGAADNPVIEYLDIADEALIPPPPPG